MVAAHPLSVPLPEAQRRRALGVVRRPSARASEERLAGLAHAGGALRHALARLAGQMVAARVWEPLGFARVGDYAREQLGMSGRELHDLAQVDSRLRELPLVEQALVEGTLPWTKVRLVCRVASPDDEAGWIALAQCVGSDDLEREVRGVDERARALCESAQSPAPADEDDDEPREAVRIRCEGRVRAMWWRACELARRQAGERLSTEACAEAIAAEVLSTVPLDGGADDEDSSVSPDGNAPAGLLDRAGPSGSEARVGPLSPVRIAPVEEPEEVAALLDGMDGCTAVQLDRRLQRVVRLEQRRFAEVASLLARVRATGEFRDLGFRSFASYAHTRLGLAPSRAYALMRLARAASAFPPLGRAFARGELSFAQAQALIPLVYEPAARAFLPSWMDRASSVTLRRLEDDATWAVAHGCLDPDELPALPSSPTGESGASNLVSATTYNPDLPAGLLVRADPRARHDPARVCIGARRSIARLFRATLATVQRRIERHERRAAHENEALEAMLAYVLGLWGANAHVRREHRVFARDGWRCTAPGCRSYKNLHDHHIVFRSRGGGDQLANRTTLCAYHHLRGVHVGRLSITGRAPEHLRYQTLLGIWAAGDRIVTAA